MRATIEIVLILCYCAIYFYANNLGYQASKRRFGEEKTKRFQKWYSDYFWEGLFSTRYWWLFWLMVLVGVVGYWSSLGSH